MASTKKRVLLALYRLEESMQEVLGKLDAPERRCTPQPEGQTNTKGGDAWLREGIDSILSYQAGAKQSEEEQE